MTHNRLLIRPRWEGIHETFNNESLLTVFYVCMFIPGYIDMKGGQKCLIYTWSDAAPW